MSKYLVIVESPTKARTIAKFLGKNYRIRASMGHLIDLPKSQFGIDIENNFQPKYITIRGKGEILSKIKAEGKKAECVYLAADPDREGEAICWHLGRALGINENENCRVEFNEITKTAVKNAFKAPRKIDMNRVEAQQARRVLDRLVGYKISPLLWRKIKKGLSAGRVQSVAVRLICDREREIEEFVPEEYWTLEAVLSSDDEENKFTAKYYGKAGKKISFAKEEEVNEVVAELENATFLVSEIKKGQRRRNPFPPFTTSSLQQEASKRLGLSTRKTMQLAQQLYEGIELQGERVGLITYMRTDSVRISASAQKEAEEFIKQQYGKEYLPEKPWQYTSKRGAQEAHEAVRPTSIYRTPGSVKDYLKRDQFRLYKLIWSRFVASQMAAAIMNRETVIISANEHQFRATGTTVAFPGFMALYAVEEEKNDKEKKLPVLEKNQLLKLVSLKPEQHFTQPPPRYSEASLVKTLEESGIGRPSTYSPIIETIQARGYVTLEDKVFKPTELGFIVLDLLKEFFQEIIDIEFTAQMENQLDEVERGKLEWTEVLKRFYASFSKSLQKAEEEVEEVEIEPEVTKETCPDCGRNLVIKYGRFGKFLACPGFPNCRYT
ncbi:MAG: type I DNA topoisomerase, partial [Firmicutes bacterium]|nr:type I DNA topoisomerase [Bacillota bacterium]